MTNQSRVFSSKGRYDKLALGGCGILREKNDKVKSWILNTDKQNCAGKKTIGADDKTF